MINLFRKLRAYLSINSHINFKNNNEDFFLYKKINNYYKIYNKKYKNPKKKTHLILINQIINLIKIGGSKIKYSSFIICLLIRFDLI